MTIATNYLEDAVLNFVTNGTAITGITPYVGLATAVTDAEAGTLTEATGGSYARVAIAASFPTASGGGTNTSNAAITFPTATADWSSGSNMTHWFIADASTAGNILVVNSLDTPQAVLNGNTAEFASGQLAVTVA